MILDKFLRNCQSHLNVKGDCSLISIFGSVCYSYQNCLGIGRFLMEVGVGKHWKWMCNMTHSHL